MSNEPEKYNSLGYFHLARGLGMLLIVLGHSITPFFPKTQPEEMQMLFSGVGGVLGGGIMAMFFMISGFGFYKRSPQKCLSIQTKLLLKPYVQVAIAILATKVILAVLEQRSFLNHGGELVLTYLLGLNAEGGGTLAGMPIESISIFWFILALLGGWVLYNGICQLKKKRVQWALIAACVVLSYVLSQISQVWPYCIPMALLTVGYLAAGNEIQKRRLLDRKLPLWCWVILLLVPLVSAAFGAVNIVACVWKLGLIDVAGSFCIGFLLLRLYARFMELEWHGRLVQTLEAIGLRSIWIVCLHAYEKAIFPWYRLKGVFPNAPGLCVLLCFLGRWAVIFLLLRLLSWRQGKPLGQRRKNTIRIEL